MKFILFLILSCVVFFGSVSCDKEVKGLKEEMKIIKEENSFLKAENIVLKRELDEVYKKLEEREKARERAKAAAENTDTEKTKGAVRTEANTKESEKKKPR